MSDGNNKICRLCLKTICDNKFDIIEEITRQMLNALLLNVNLDERKQGVMCPGCATKLQNAIDFKTACLNRENKISPFSTSEENMKQNNLKESTILELIDERICRFCMKVLEMGCYTSLQNMAECGLIVNMVQKYIPELRLCINDELIACEACLVSLQELLSFITSCLGAEEKNNIDEPENEGKPKLNGDEGFKNKVGCSNVDVTKMEDNCDKSENDVTVKREIGYEDIMEVDNFELNVNSEEIKVKSELTNSESFQNTASSEWNLNNLHEYESSSGESSLEEDSQAHKNKMYKCEKCAYQAKYKHFVEQHALIHKNSSDIKLYECETCSYKVKSQGGLKRHMMVHQVEVKRYNCEKCAFETASKSILTRHLLIHQDLSEAVMYKCEKCSFETKYKGNLKKHMLSHEDLSNVTVYQCEMCLFETKRKDSLKKHLLTHQVSSEVTIYKCENCSFETRHKISLKRHSLSHQDPSEVMVYKCDICAYATNRRYHLKMHMRVHQNPSEIKMYNCHLCSFTTKHQRSFVRHVLRH